MENYAVLTDKTQPENTGAVKKELVIGVDFGAAFTKVVIGDGRVRYAVPFSAFAHTDNPYCLTSRLTVDGKGACGFVLADSEQNPDSHSKENLKLPLIINTFNEEDLFRIAAYLALVFRASRGWLLEHYKQRYDDTELNWSINAALPAESFDDDKVAKLYSRLLHTAWIVSVLPGPITINRVRNYLSADEVTFDLLPQMYRSRILQQDRITATPSHSAQIFAYAFSIAAKDGLHMSIDIGTNSLSLTTFNIDGADSSDTHCNIDNYSIESLGIRSLLERRYKNLGLPVKDINLFERIADVQSFAEKYGLSDKEVKIADTLYNRDITRLINATLDGAKQRYPDSSHWATGIPTLCSCGGARLDVLQNISHKFEHNKPPHRIKAIKPETPEDMIAEDLSQSTFDQLSVAYGLSFGAGVIGELFRGSVRDIESAA